MLRPGVIVGVCRVLVEGLQYDTFSSMAGVVVIKTVGTTVLHHPSSSCIIMHRHLSSYIIMNRHTQSCFIMLHHASICIMHQTTSLFTRHHPSPIYRHTPEYIIVLHHSFIIHSSYIKLHSHPLSSINHLSLYIVIHHHTSSPPPRESLTNRLTAEGMAMLEDVRTPSPVDHPSRHCCRHAEVDGQWSMVIAFVIIMSAYTHAHTNRPPQQAPSQYHCRCAEVNGLL